MNLTPGFSVLKYRQNKIILKIVYAKNISYTCSLMESTSKSKYLREII